MSEAALTFNPFFDPVYLALASAFLIVLLLTYEWNRRIPRRWLRMSAQIMAVAGLLTLLLNPGIRTAHEDSPGILLTEGYPMRTVDSLRQAHPNCKLYTLAPATPFQGAEIISSPANLREINLKYVLGYGVPAYALSRQTRPFTFIASSKPEGITELNFSTRYMAYRFHRITGDYYLNQTGTRRLLLIGPAGVEDSTQVSKSGKTHFSLTFYAKTAAVLEYDLVEKDSTGRTLRSNPLWVNVVPETKLRILMLGSQPGFEQRFLKNFLAENGHQVIVRNLVSQNRYQTEFVNQPKTSEAPLSREMMINLDLIISDPGALRLLHATGRSQIEEAIENGLGLLIVPGAETQTTQIGSYRLTYEKQAANPVHLKTMSGNQYQLNIQPLKSLLPDSTLLYAENHEPLESAVYFGMGKIGYQMLPETFQVGLSGNLKDYASIWTPLIDAIAKPTTRMPEIKIESPFPWYQNMPLSISVIGNSAGPLYADSIKLPLMENIELDAVWSGQCWLEGLTTHALRSDATELNFHLVPDSTWTPLRLSHQLKANKWFSSSNTAEAEPSKTHYTSVPAKFFGMVLFLVGVGLVWLSPKLE